jgi:uridine monophosphate synthetase
MGFFQQLEARAVQRNTLLCVGLDPRPERFPPEVAAQEDPLFAFNKRVIDATHDLVCAYKPNYAFYEAQGIEGLRALRRTIEYVGPEIPVILDAKRGDIGSTSAALARAAFEVWGAGAVTVAPYLGSDSIAPFTAYADRGVFVLCHTSNPGASELQTLEHDDESLYLRVARLSQGWSETENIGLVVGATYPKALREVRARAPRAWFLVPGIGTQGGDLEEAVAAGLRAEGLGMAINVSRAVCFADDPSAAARQFRDQINDARARIPVASNAPSPRLGVAGATGHHTAPPPAPSPRPGGVLAPASEPLISKPTALEDEGLERCKNEQTDLILDLARIGAVRFGQFTLKSGATSPIYIDLRLLASYPKVLGRVAAAYVELLRGLEYDRIAAIPYAALPIGTAVALQTGRPLIYPRKEVKDYGTQRTIEGEYAADEQVVVLDDLITTGGSKIEAIEPLTEAGLTVQDVVVLIDRESGGQMTLAHEGLHLHAVLTLRQILGVLAARGTITQQQRTHIMDWLAEQ